MNVLINNDNKLVNKAIIIFIIMATSKILGLARDMLLAYKFGTTDVVDAYTVAITLPNVLFAVFISGINQSYLPYYVRIEDRKKKEIFFSNALLLYTTIALIATLIGFYTKSQIAFLLAPGFDVCRQYLCSEYIGIVIWMFPFYILFALLSAQLQTYENFTMSNICDFLITNIITIIFILIATPSTDKLLPIGYTLSMAIASFVLFLYFRRVVKIDFCPDLKIAFVQFREVMTFAIPVGMSYMINQLNSVTDAIFSSNFSGGVTSGLNYANRIQSLFLTLTTSVFMTVIFPRINTYFAQHNFVEGTFYIRKGVVLSSWVSIPFALYVGLFSNDIVSLIFQRGAFDNTSTTITASCLALYALGIPFYSYVEIESRTLTANLKQRLILKHTIFAVCFNIALDVFLMNCLGYRGLALATSFTGLVLCILHAEALKKDGLHLFDVEFIIETVKIVVAASLSIIVALIVKAMIPSTINGILKIGIMSCTFGGAYLFLTFLMRLSEISWISHSKSK